MARSKAQSRKRRRGLPNSNPPRLATRWRSLRLLAGAMLLSLVFMPDSQPQTQVRSVGQAKDPSAGHQKMIALLKEIAARTADENPWLGDRAVRILGSRYRALPKDASDVEKWRLGIELANEELRVGNERQAIERFSRACEALPRLEERLTATGVVYPTYRLGVAYLRLGETQNCSLMNIPEACILPIRGGGIHTLQEGSKRAVQHFTTVLKQTAKDSSYHLRARWLLNIAYMTLGRYPDDVPEPYLIPPQVFESEEPFPRFENISARLTLNTFNLSGGAIVDDFDSDGYLDIVTSTWDTSGQIHFFRNNQDGTFSDRTEEAGLLGLYGGLNLVQADYNNDGNLDIFVLRGAWLEEAGRHPNSLLRNNGEGTFTDVTFEAGLGEFHYPTQTAAWADYDNDGDLDLYIGNEDTSRLSAPCQLFQNNGDGTFTDVAKQAGVENLRWAKAVVWGDYNGDRFPDLYVSNLEAPNRLYQNNGNGRFTDVAAKLGVTRPIASFPVWFWDFNNDGLLDLYVPSYGLTSDALTSVAASYLGLPFSQELPCLYRGDRGGGFQEVARQHNLRRVSLPMGANFGDLDNDGYLDFYLGTGYPDYEALTPNVMYHNRNGTGFADVTAAGGFGHLQKGHAIVFADIDNDGDQDIFEQMGGAFPGDKFSDALYENPGFGNHWITIKLIGTRSNRSAIGARIRLEVIENDRRRSIYNHVNSGGSFGANPLSRTIGLGKASRVDLLEVYWPTTNLTQTFREVPIDQFIRIVEGDDKYTTYKLKKLSL